MTPYQPHVAHVTRRVVETDGVLTFHLRFADPEVRRNYRFAPGQFNMLYCFGVGEVPISIVSGPASDDDLEHTIRIVGHVTQAMARWQKGDAVGIRGPYGRGWPIDEARGRDVIVVTGGLGCAPVAGAIHYMLQRRAEFGDLQILHGVKAPRDLLYRERFLEWRRAPRTRILLTADEPDADWHYDVGVVTDLFDELEIRPDAIVLMCGPEAMMRYAGRRMTDSGIPEESIHVSVERNMKCAIGLCGHCQIGGAFACKDGPVFRYDEVRPIFAMETR